MEDCNITISMTHPPYPTRTTSGPSISSPMPEHVDLAFIYAEKYGHGRVGDIWVNWICKDKQGDILDHREMLFAVSRESNYCFAVRVRERDAGYQNLVWSHGAGSDEVITIEDSGCGSWRFKAGSKVPVVDAIALAKRFVSEGYVGDDFEWELEPVSP